MKKHEAIADISYLAGVYGYYSGDSRADIQLFISLAEKFEYQNSHIDWDTNLDYMIEIEKFACTELNLKSKLYFGYPKAFDEQWDNIEVERCRTVGGDTYPIHDDNDIEPNDFWSVYVHQVSGGCMCIADLPSEEAAIGLRKLLTKAVRSFKDNRYMGLYDNKALQEEFNTRIDKMIDAEDPKMVFKSQLEMFKRKINKMFI